MKAITISSKHQIVVPKAVRMALGVGAGDKLIVEQLGNGHVVLKKQPTYRDLIGSAQCGEGDPVDRIRALRDDWR
ncbi:MAG TPA: AbrB/MazE/SpoVT family DNA-binding domain-containing protein [Candidatus Saccharimonadales bacterium]